MTIGSPTLLHLVQWTDVQTRYKSRILRDLQVTLENRRHLKLLKFVKFTDTNCVELVLGKGDYFYDGYQRMGLYPHLK